ncbi:MAG TPA: ABC transporter substrate-binding protein [Actinomycetota bacterium]|nr:ABC transporter substrate-binding protein [Actinomycetota bacterium]
MDPQLEYSPDSWELFRCCLTRTLLANPGLSTQEHGADLYPDIAAALPEVSSDGLTWTFRLRRGIHYAPPMRQTEVTAEDFIRALQRDAKLGKESYSSYFSVIEGFDAYAAGKADTILGLEAPDPHTLVIRLNQPSGDLGYLLTLPASSPIPPSPTQPNAPFGVATGHDADGYGFYLVATGPYMLEGSDKLDFSLPPKEQPKVSGLAAGSVVTLVRNPSWDPSTSGGLRPAYVDRIEVRFPSDVRAEVARLVTTGKADVDLDDRPGAPQIIRLASSVRADPALGFVHVEQRDFIRYVSINLAVPPFDDIHVRRAMNYVIDKAKLQQVDGGPIAGAFANHLAPDSMENNQLIAYDPFHTPDESGDLAKAKAEMAQSRYDRNHDGVCDAPVCKGLYGLAIAGQDVTLKFVQMGQEVARELLPLGLHVRSVAEPAGPLFSQINDPRRHVPLAFAIGFGRDIPNGSTWFPSLFTSLSAPNPSLIGATATQLRRWGYRVGSVPSVDDRVHACLELRLDAQTRCWTSLDEYLSEAVVPWIPILFELTSIFTSTRVVAYAFDEFTIEPALDRMALKTGS